MSLSSRYRPERRSVRAAVVAAVAVAVCAVLWPAAPTVAAARLQVVAVLPSPNEGDGGRRIGIVADVSPPPERPIPSGSFTVSEDGRRMDTETMPVISAALDVALVVDASAAEGDLVQAGLTGAADFLLQLPAAARVAVVTDGGDPAVVSPLRSGPSEALRALSGVRGEGDRHTADAADLAVRQLPASAAGPRLVVLYTGARDAGDASADDLSRRVAAAGALLAVVTTGTDQRFWQRVTGTTGGVVAVARSEQPADVTAAFGTVSSSLRGRYLLVCPVPGDLPATLSVVARTPDGPISAVASIPEDVGGFNLVASPSPSTRRYVLWVLASVLWLIASITAVAFFFRSDGSRSQEAEPS